MKSRWAGCLIEIVETIVLTLVIFFVVQHFVAQPYQILQQSMVRQPVQLSGDLAQLSDYAWRRRAPSPEGVWREARTSPSSSA
jgi:hypothetical protein